MKCNENKIMDFIDDKLTEEKAHEVEEHLNQCKHCKSIYNRLMVLENMEEDKEFFKVDLSDKVMASIGENIYQNQKKYTFKEKFIDKGNHFFKYVAVALISLVITTGIVVGKNGELLNYFKGGNKEEIGAKNNTEDSNKTLGININNLIKYKNSYVGDNSAVGGILTNLPGGKFRNGFSLKTDKTPYGIEVNYKPEDNVKSSEEFNKLFNEKDSENLLMDNAITLFILVTNVDEIKFNLKGAKETSFYVTRAEVESFYGKKMTEYAEDKALWEKEIINSKARPSK